MARGHILEDKRACTPGGESEGQLFTYRLKSFYKIAGVGENVVEQNIRIIKERANDVAAMIGIGKSAERTQ